HELTCRLALGTSLGVTKGWAAPEAEAAYTRARELCQQMEDTPQLFQVLSGLWVFYQVRPELPMAREFGEQGLSLAQRLGAAGLLGGAHCARGATSQVLGALLTARQHLEQGITLYDPQQHRAYASLYGFDPGVLGRSFATQALWLLGYADQALTRSHETLALAQELSHPMSLAIALDYTAMFHQFRRERHAAQERAEAAMVLCTEQGFAYYLAWATIIQGWTLAEQGQTEEV